MRCSIKTLSIIFLFLWILPVSSNPSVHTIEPFYNSSITKLYIPKYNQEFFLVSSITGLEKNHISMLEPLTDFNHTILLFGHNNKQAFHFLYDLQEGDELILQLNNQKKHYFVQERKFISVFNKQYLEISPAIELRMFTCTLNKDTRYMIIAKP